LDVLSLAGRWLVAFIGDRENLEAAHGQIASASLARTAGRHARTGLLHAWRGPRSDASGFRTADASRSCFQTWRPSTFHRAMRRNGRASQALGLGPEPQALGEWLPDLCAEQVGLSTGDVGPDGSCAERWRTRFCATQRRPSETRAHRSETKSRGPNNAGPALNFVVNYERTLWCSESV
jgi:hypothetical protein